ncbi:tetratricopeptide repeat protein [Salinispirillum sp. LH 10-3-1]|uniref:Tetratricopeptide repeat protein n=1 Tax=Salinispirillum sp. LH 10-3-1 TaxID=2952525 RepID=A0AB38YC49_9GAMM
MTRLFAVVSAITLFCVAGFASAVGLGEITLRSALTEPLEAEIRITSPGDFSVQDLNVRLASATDFSRAGIERPFFLTQIDFSLRQVGSAIVVDLSTTDTVEEPFLDFLVELTWPGGRLLREYTLLLDPPVFAEGESGQIQVFPAQEPSFQSAAPATPPTATVTPAPQPARPTPAPVTPRQEQLADNQYRVENNDTLWEIALRARQNPSQSPQQIMLAIQDLNPDAFIGGNINRVKAGSLLTLPSGEQIVVRSRAQAVTEVDNQNRALRGLPPIGQSQISATGDAASATGAPAQRDPDGFLELVGTPTDSDVGGAEGEASRAELARVQNDLAIQQELNDELRRQNQDQLSRLNELEEQVALLSQMMELQSASAADLQAAARALAEEVEQDQTMVPETPAASDQPSMSATPDTTPPTIVLEPMAPPPTLMDQVMGWLDRMIKWVSQPINAAIVALALFVVIAMGAIARRRKQEEEDFSAEVAGESDSGAFDGFDDDLELSGDDDPEQQSYAPPASTTFQQNSGASAEAIENAELYIAFQRFDEAESVLKQALSDEPGHAALQLKLLELYAESGQADAFEALAAKVGNAEQDAVARLRAQLSAAAPAVSKAAGSNAADSDDDFADLDLDLDLDVGDEWDASSPSLAESDEDLSLDFIDETERLDTSASDSLPELDAGLEDELSLDIDLPELNDEADVLADAPVKSAADDNSMDFDLGDWAVPEESSAGTSAEREAEDLSLDMDFDLSSLDDEPDELPSLDMDKGESDTEIPELKMDDDFTRSLSDTLDQLSDEEPEASLDADDFADLGDLSDLGDFDRTTGDTALTDGGLEDFDLADDMTFSAADDEFTEQTAKADIESSDDWDDDFDFLAGSDEVSTKLDLARAYIDMDDAEGARDILAEVMEEGSAEQKAEAEALVRKL